MKNISKHVGRMEISAYKILKINSSRSISPKAWKQLIILQKKRERAQGDKKQKYILAINNLLIYEGLVSNIRNNENECMSLLNSIPKKVSV